LIKIVNVICAGELIYIEFVNSSNPQRSKSITFRYHKEKGYRYKSSTLITHSEIVDGIFKKIMDAAFQSKYRVKMIANGFLPN